MTNVSEKQNLAYELARNLVGVEFKNIPFEAVEIAKKSTLDTLGVIVGASGITPGALLQGMVEIKTKVGDAYRRRVDQPYGHTQQPMSMVDIVEKFKGCASCSVKPLRGTMWRR